MTIQKWTGETKRLFWYEWYGYRLKCLCHYMRFFFMVYNRDWGYERVDIKWAHQLAAGATFGLYWRLK
jgi:hypothetical protein